MGTDRVWAEAAPGDLQAGVNVAHVKGEPGTLIMYEGAPDWVLDPETQEPVRVEFAQPVADFDCRSCGRRIVEPTLVLSYPSRTRGGSWFTYACHHCEKWVSALLAPEAKEKTL
jgi:hypothetical protein